MVAKVNVSFPQEVLQELDRAARECHTSRSAFLVQAVKRYLEEKEEERKKEQRLRAAASIRRIAEELGPWDGTAEILGWRDAH
ncbi:MAG: type II toxin-antitoxin system HicB family antitoxin [Chloroflexi bacterium]|nr:type II toxin-antitoxin system HicB family antitoxin [Chloroflexota bacterium]